MKKLKVPELASVLLSTADGEQMSSSLSGRAFEKLNAAHSRERRLWVAEPVEPPPPRRAPPPRSPRGREKKPQISGEWSERHYVKSPGESSVTSLFPVLPHAAPPARLVPRTVSPVAALQSRRSASSPPKQPSVEPLAVARQEQQQQQEPRKLDVSRRTRASGEGRHILSRSVRLKEEGTAFKNAPSISLRAPRVDIRGEDPKYDHKDRPFSARSERL